MERKETLSAEQIATIVAYWQQPTGMANAPGGMVELARHNIGQLEAEIRRLTTALEKAHFALAAIATGREEHNCAGEWECPVCIAREALEAVSAADLSLCQKGSSDGGH